MEASTVLARVAQDAVTLPGILSAAIFVARRGADALELGGAAGVSGPALDRLVDAVRDPRHPIARTQAEAIAAYDVVPMAPGGPALRSHVPLLRDASAGVVRSLGVLAVAHDEPVSAEVRDRLVELASEAASSVG